MHMISRTVKSHSLNADPDSSHKNGCLRAIIQSAMQGACNREAMSMQFLRPTRQPCFPSWALALSLCLHSVLAKYVKCCKQIDKRASCCM